jgi:hypothetical protein
MPQLFNDLMDDVPADANCEGFTGMDNAMKPDQLPPNLLHDGSNMWCDATGMVLTRPGLSLNAFLDDGTTLSAGDTRVQGLGYYDTPTIETLLAVRNGKLYEVDSSETGAAFTHLTGPTPSATADVAFAQLVDRMFYIDGTTLRWALYTTVWTHGSVSTFSTAATMPVWATILAHGFRLLAVESKGYKLYASAIGTAHNPADWVPTENIRVGTGEGDPIKTLISGQGGTLIVLCLGSAWQVDTTDASLANWTVRKITDVAGCVEAKTAVSVGQDVFFLSRYGVVSLGALANNISLNPAATLSAPVQPLIDRINWLAIGTAYATVWQELYLLALPLDDDTLPNHILAFNIRTRQWMPTWEPGSQGILTGTTSAAVAVDEVAEFLCDETGAVWLDSGTTTPTLTAVEFSGLSAGTITRFAGKQETILGDSTGRLLRIDPTSERDDICPTISQPIASWCQTKAQDFGAPQHAKQPFIVDLQFERSTGIGVQINLVRDGQLTYPDITQAASEAIATGLVTGTLVSYPLVFPVAFKPNTTYRRTFNARNLPRFLQASLQVSATSGRLRLRSAKMSAFIDTPDLIV